MQIPKLAWDEKYSVKVAQIDLQHKKMFETINLLIDLVSDIPVQKEKVDEIIAALIEYKQYHFKTEEEYFDKFHFEEAEHHIAKHKEFGQKLEEITKESGGDSVVLAFKLVDFLEDWLIDHLMGEDQKYVACFQEHGLK
jgi:hemerythrin-like metal-binding protein